MSESVRTLHGHDGGVFSISFHPKGNVIASAGGDLSAASEDRQANEGDERTSVADRGHRVRTEWKIARFGGTERHSEDVGPQSGAQERTLQKHADSVASVAVSPDGKTLVLGSDDKTIRFGTRQPALGSYAQGARGKVEGWRSAPTGNACFGWARPTTPLGSKDPA